MNDLIELLETEIGIETEKVKEMYSDFVKNENSLEECFVIDVEYEFYELTRFQFSTMKKMGVKL